MMKAVVLMTALDTGGFALMLDHVVQNWTKCQLAGCTCHMLHEIRVWKVPEVYVLRSHVLSGSRLDGWKHDVFHSMSHGGGTLMICHMYHTSESRVQLQLKGGPFKGKVCTKAAFCKFAAQTGDLFFVILVPFFNEHNCLHLGEMPKYGEKPKPQRQQTN